MADDLASRISDGAVAVLELVPGEQRFADLSNYVLRGGASRFAPVVLDDEHLRYVLPVGIPAAKLDYGTLLIQKSRCALVWRSEPSRPYHALIAELGPETTIAQSPVTVRGEVWGRFDVRRPGLADMTFLVPPVASTALPRMLHRVLVDEPGSKQGRIASVPLSREVVDGPITEPEVGTEGVPGDDDEITSLLPPLVPASPTEEPAGREPEPAASTASLDLAATQVLPSSKATAPPSSAAAPTWTPRRPEPEPSEAADDSGLYREATRTMPLPIPTQPLPAPLVRPTAVAPSGRSREVERTPAHAEAPMADPLKGFLVGFVATVVVGGLFVLAKVMGWLG